jgi:hypothetical protein
MGNIVEMEPVFGERKRARNKRTGVKADIYLGEGNQRKCTLV